MTMEWTQAPLNVKTTTLIAMTAAAIGLTGCGQPPSAPPAAAHAPAASAVPENHDGDHAHGDHDHGAGPHGGTLADWGGGRYHVEFTVDHDVKEATVYVLAADEKTPTPVKVADGKLLLTIREPALQVELPARPLEGETAEAASRYGGRHESLGLVRDFAGTISGEVDGTPYAGDFAEHAHDHEQPGGTAVDRE
jgi:hypothetical protein